MTLSAISAPEPIAIPEDPPPAFGLEAQGLFQLEEGIAQLNHGSYGATARALLQQQRRWQDHMEAEPSRFMRREFPSLLRDAAAAIGGYINGDADRIAMVENATTGVNAVVGGGVFQEGDEVLIFDQTYGAVTNTVRHMVGSRGARVIVADLPFPAQSDDQIMAAVEHGLAQFSPKAANAASKRLVILDHVTSPTALLLPIRDMVARAREHGVSTLVDGAHAPGMAPIDLASLGADYYTGNCHKWLCAPKGCAFLWAAEDAPWEPRPPVTSHGWGGGFIEEFDWIGTRDASAQFVLPDTLALRRWLGDEEVSSFNHSLVVRAAALLSAAWKTPLGAPASMCGSMTTIALPFSHPQDVRAKDAEHVRAILLDDFGVEVPVRQMGEQLWVRISAQIYNTLEDYERLAHAALTLKSRS